MAKKAAKKVAKNLPPCPICGQPMDFCVISFRNHPFIDGKLYKQMCFACAHVPEDFVQTYDEKGNVASEEGPFFDWKHLRTPEDLVLVGSAETLEQAGRCVRAVRRIIKEVGARELNKLKLRRPQPEYLDLESHGGKDYDDEVQERPKRRKRAVAVEQTEENEPAPIPRRRKPVKKRPMVKEVVIKKFTASKKPRSSEVA